MKTAKRIKDGLLLGNAALYELSEPHKTYEGVEYNHVIVSAVKSYLAYEPYIFPSDADGNVVDWGEMPGSERGTQSHERVLENAGYEVV